MKRGALSNVVRHLKQQVGSGLAGDLADAELLEQFCTYHEETAFTLLVQRHGPMILNLCRRLLPNQQDAEDVFQATFFVLARKAGSIRKRQALASWLYGVAYRIARKVRRQIKPVPFVESVPEPAMQPTEPDWELRRLLDEAIQQLPEKYRLPVLLCYLQGKTHEQASQELACPKTSLTSRLSRACELLQDRLRAKGYAYSTASLTGFLASQTVSARIPDTLLISTVRSAIPMSVGKVIEPSSASLLAQQYIQRTTMTYFTTTASLLLTLGLAIGITFSADPAKEPPPQKAEKSETRPIEGKADSQPKEDLPSRAVARLGTTRLRHGGDIQCLIRTEDGQSLISSANDGVTRFWNVADGKQTRILKSMNPAIHLSIGSEEKTLIDWGYDGIEIFDLETSKRIKQIQTAQPAFVNASSMLLSKDRKQAFIGAEGNKIYAYDLINGKQQFILEGHTNSIMALALSKDGETLISGSMDGMVFFWSLKAKKKIQTIDNLGQVQGLAVSEDGKSLAISASPRIALAEIPSGKLLRHFEENGFGSIHFLADGTILNMNRILDPKTGKVVKSFDLFGTHHVIGPKEEWVASYTNGNNSTIQLWDLRTGKSKFDLAAHTDVPRAVIFSVDNKRVFTGSWREDSVFTWSAETGKSLGLWKGKPLKSLFGLTGGSDVPSQDGASALAVSQDGKLLAAGHGLARGTLRLWDLTTNQELRTFSTPHPHHMVLAFSPDGKYLVSADYNANVCIWEIPSGKQQHRLQGPFGQHKAIAFAADGKSFTVAASGYDRKETQIASFDLLSGKELWQQKKEFGAISQLALSSDGKRLALASYSIAPAQVIDLPTGKTIMQAETYPQIQSAIAFSPDGKSVAIAYGDNLIHLVEVCTGKQRCSPFTGHLGWIERLAFSPNGQYLVSTARDTTGLVWNIADPRVQPTSDAKELESLWNDLGSSDVKKAYRAICTFWVSGKAGLDLLSQRLKPIAPLQEAEQKRFEGFVQQLTDKRFAVREKADKEIRDLGDRAEAPIRKMLQQKLEAETQQRLEKILEQRVETPSAASLTLHRCLEILERHPAAEANQLLQTLATGAPQAQFTIEAKASLERRKKR